MSERRGARGGSAARRAARGQRSITQLPFITRRFPVTEVLSDEGLEIIENNAEPRCHRAHPVAARTLWRTKPCGVPNFMAHRQGVR